MIYTTFKQWVKGRFLETGEPRIKAYSKDERDLIEMGWGYGYDAGVEWQKSQTALDKKADNARDLGLDYEPVIEIANQASKEWLKEFPTPEETAHQVPKRFLEIFAKLVAEKECEECAKIADEIDPTWESVSASIRKRGQE